MRDPEEPTVWNRRHVLRSGALLGAGAVLGGMLPARAQSHASVAQGPSNPLVRQRADPFIARHSNGLYYFTASVPEYDRIIIRASPTIGGLTTAEETTVWRRPASGTMGGYIWAPELHFIDGRWYLHVAAGDSDDPFHIRMYVLENRATDPREGTWTVLGRITTPLDTFALDATTFLHGGRRYLCWAQNDPAVGSGTNLYLAEMSSPSTITGTPVRIATPTHDWETRGHRVNEGPAFLARNGQLFMSFSASATDANYCVGLLTADPSSNLLDPRSWRKNPYPVFASSDRNSQYGPGHNMFTVSEDNDDVLVYHARQYEHIEGDPLFDPNRHTRVQKLSYHPDGTPDFGVPVPDGPVSL